MENKELKFIAIKKNLAKLRMKNIDKQKLLEKYTVIIRDVPSTKAIITSKGTVQKVQRDIECIKEYFEACNEVKKADKLFIFHGVVLPLTDAQYFLLYTVLQETYLDDNEYRKHPFRKKACSKKDMRAKRAIVKDVGKLKKCLKAKIKIYNKDKFSYFSSQTEDEFEKRFDSAFYDLIHIEDFSHGISAKTNYKWERFSQN